MSIASDLLYVFSGKKKELPRSATHNTQDSHCYSEQFSVPDNRKLSAMPLAGASCRCAK